MNKLIHFLTSEEGSILEWIIGAAIIGIGTIPIIIGIVHAVLYVTEQGEERILKAIWAD
ncbi:hypothetical protein JOC37_001316 [Desulfohalotomaculum tongense]|uniref:hypothetical protein n=1 Tax=Desulforadius tongensis TaxID=1216062 RepID=UPI001957FF97|nr:hypothetical protein [Desulforadius tongensis]MBM7854936.1 hypothetical protein [Desulforadius tongensis]